LYQLVVRPFVAGQGKVFRPENPQPFVFVMIRPLSPVYAANESVLL